VKGSGAFTEGRRFSADDQARVSWRVDPWDDPGEVPVVETPPRRGLLLRWVVGLVAAALIASVLAAGWTGWWLLERVSPSGASGELERFDISEGDSVATIAGRLESRGLVSDAGVFEWYVSQRGGLEPTPGFYRIAPGWHMGDVLGTLRTPPSETYVRITFPEGFTVEQIADRVGERIEQMESESFLEFTLDPTRAVPYRPGDIASLEGLLFPDTYQVSNADNEGQLVERMIELLERVALQEELDAGAERLGLTPYEVLTVASMIEREAKVDADRPRIARVIYNRLDMGMNLEIDATLRYGQEPDTPFSVLRFTDSPYNTYMYPGLPPTPIANPGRASIRAALNPSPDPPSGDPLCQVLDDPTTGCRLLFYVLADFDGGHAFAVTFEQHQENIAAASRAGVLP
jgi:UPF0755 protein